ncbi:MAG: hypothetical protein HYZ43_13810, partial [Flavobacteriia bacterium]|nr:hypothetical protein [Flavobacteriia bacterium]
TTNTIEEKQLTVFTSVDSVKKETSFFPKEFQVTIAELPELSDTLSEIALAETNTSVDVTSTSRFKQTLNGYREQVTSLAKKAETIPEHNGQKKSQLAVILITVLLFMLALALIYLAIVAETPILALFGVLLGMASIILLLVGLAAEDSAANTEKAEKVKAENELKKKQKEQLSDEEWDELKQKQYQKAVRTTILLIVLFFAISLFAIAVGEPMPLIVITGAMFLIFLAFVWGTYKSKRPENPAIKTER